MLIIRGFVKMLGEFIFIEGLLSLETLDKWVDEGRV